MKKINLAIIGLGQRGGQTLQNVLLKMEDVNVMVVCDLYEDRIADAIKKIREQGGDAKGFTDYKEALDQKGIDAVIVFSSWDGHSEHSMYAMEKGIPVASEVGCEYTIERCFDLVRTYERTRTPYMFMENCCYGKEEILVTSMVRKGLLGTIVHCAGKYNHDLREEVSYGIENRHYRFNNYKFGNFENYPTHELGPIARLLNINRGNRIVSVNSISSKAVGLEEYIKEQAKTKEISEYLLNTKFSQGDVVDTIIKCSGGETIHLQLDTTIPGYYSRGFTVKGTKGQYEGNSNSFFIEGTHEDAFLDAGEYLKKIIGNATEYEEHLPDFWKYATQETINAGHGGMDYFAYRAFIDAVKNHTKMPIDVYDGATWMAVSALSANSIALGGQSQVMPDFTNGKWMITEPEDVF